MPLDPGIDIILWVQSGPEWFLTAMKWVSIVGVGGLYFFAIAVVYWVVNRGAGLKLALFLTFSGSLNALAKLWLHMPRPYWLDLRIRPLELHSSFGMPSGHAQTAAVTWLGTAWLIKKWWAWVVALLALAAIGVSRVALGVHSPLQVLVGWALGLALLGAFVLFERLLWPRLSHWQTWRLALSIVGLGGLVILVSLLVRWTLNDWHVPVAWQQRMGKALGPDPLPLKDVLRSGGAFIGLALGALWAHRTGLWSLSRDFRSRVVTLVFGLTGVAGILLGGRLLRPQAAFAVGALHLVRSLVMGWWITGGTLWAADRVLRLGRRDVADSSESLH